MELVQAGMRAQVLDCQRVEKTTYQQSSQLPKDVSWHKWKVQLKALKIHQEGTTETLEIEVVWWRN